MINQKVGWLEFQSIEGFRITNCEPLILELNRTRNEIAQALTHAQRHMSNAWSEMVILTPCLALYCSFSTWFSQTIWDNSSPTTDQPCKLITTLFLLVLHFYDYEQSIASFSTSKREGVAIRVTENIWMWI